MVGDDTRFLTGTDEHSVNIAQQAAAEGRPPRAFVDEKVELFRAAEDALLIAPTGSSGRPTRTTSGRPRRWSAGRTPTATSTSARTRAGTARTRGSGRRRDVARDGARDDLPEPSRRPAPVADGAELVLPPVGLPGAARALLRRPPGLRPARLPAQRDARLHPAAASRTSRSAGPARGWGIPFPIAENGETAQREDGSVGSRGGHDLRLVRRADQLHHRGRLPGRSRRVRPVVAGRPPRDRQGHRPVPHDLLAGDAVERRARGAAPGSGSTAGCSSRRRADEQEPRQLPRPGRRSSPRSAPTAPATSTLREVPFDRDADVSLGLVRPALQRRPRQRLRQPRQPDGVDGEPLPRRRAPGPARASRRSPLGDAWADARAGLSASGSRAASSTRRWPTLLGVRRRRRTRRSTPSSRGSWRRRPRPATRRPPSGSGACSATSSRRAGSSRLAAAPFMPGDRAAGARAARPRLSVRGRTATAGRRCSTSWPGAPTRARPGG